MLPPRFAVAFLVWGLRSCTSCCTTQPDGVTWTGEQLFFEPIEAWVNGPVVADLWADEKHGRQGPSTQPLSDRHLATLDYVIDRYGSLTGQQLIRQTHQEGPWVALGETEEPARLGGSAEISVQALQAWFEQDGEFLDRCADATRLRKRLGADPFAPPEHNDELASAVQRAVVGKKVLHQRPK